MHIILSNKFRNKLRRSMVTLYYGLLLSCTYTIKYGIIYLLKQKVEENFFMGETRELTFGEKAVGLTFNPSNDPDVQELKELYAKVIDKLDSLKAARQNGDYMTNTLDGMALRDAIRAQMSAVKTATWGKY